MAKQKKIPKLGHHRASGQGRVILDGRTIYLGEFGTPECEAKYRQVIGQWLASGTTPEPPRSKASPSTYTVSKLVLDYLTRHADGYYRHADGTHTSEFRLMREALGELVRTYGDVPAEELTPPQLKSLRALMVDRGLARTNINSRIGRIRRAWRWAVSEGLVPVATYQALMTLSGLRKGRSKAKETEPIQPANIRDVAQTFRELPPTIRAMVKVQLYSGCRPGEVCLLHPRDVDTSSDTWKYIPERHKTQHHGHSRIIHLGPRAQRALRPYLDGDGYCFDPRRAIQERHQRRRKLDPPRRPGLYRNPVEKPQRVPAEKYGHESYRRAISEACKRAGVDHWSPNQLRHLAGTMIRKRFGLEAAQVSLGHSEADVTQIYAMRDEDLAVRVAREIG